MAALQNLRREISAPGSTTGVMSVAILTPTIDTETRKNAHTKHILLDLIVTKL
jgi:hypothetical protein